MQRDEKILMIAALAMVAAAIAVMIYKALGY